jgi:ATPases of the AAA+ class
MASGEQVKALLKSYKDGDDARFLSVALQVAADEARKGHGKLAQEIRDLVDAAKGKVSVRKSPGAAIPMVQPRGELAGLLTVCYPKLLLSDMVLEPEIRERLKRVLEEQRNEEKLRHHGLVPRSRLLLIGPPGTGKTMTAAALAGELRLPLFSILLDGLITKYMGETAAKLRLIFDAIQKVRGVYLFDEFDAIGSRRSVQNDVGEIRRILNSFLQFVEQEECEGIVVAATNHIELLDRAVFRRFDDVIEYKIPRQEYSKQLIQNRLSMLDTKAICWTEVISIASGLSYGDLVRACADVAKELILQNKREVTTEILCSTLKQRKATEGRNENS